MLESDWLMNVLRCAIIFRETHGERSLRQVLTALYDHIQGADLVILGP